MEIKHQCCTKICVHIDTEFDKRNLFYTEVIYLYVYVTCRHLLIEQTKLINEFNAKRKKIIKLIVSLQTTPALIGKFWHTF